MKGKPLLVGISAGVKGTVVGKVRIINGDEKKLADIQDGDILVGDNPRPINLSMEEFDGHAKRAGAFILNTGGKSSRLVIRGMEWGIPAIAGTAFEGFKKPATEVLKEGQLVVVEGYTHEEQRLDSKGKPYMKKFGTVFEWLPDKPTKPSTQEEFPDISDLLAEYGVDIEPPATSSDADWVHAEVLRIAAEVDYGRGKHAQTVTRLLQDMYNGMVAIGLIVRTTDKDKLFEAAGLAHDIGVGKEKAEDYGDHAKAGKRVLKEKLWTTELSLPRKALLAVIMYAVFYHRNPIPGGKVKPLNDLPPVETNTTELVTLLRVADGLDFGKITGSPDMIERVEMVRPSEGVECRVFPRPDKDVTGLLAKAYEKREVFEAHFGKLTFWLPGEGGSWVPWHPKE